MLSADMVRHMKYCVNVIEYNGIFHTCGRLAVAKHCPYTHGAYLCIIFVKIFSVVASINFTSPYNVTQ